MKKELPIFRFVVGENDGENEGGVTAVALVDFPAIELDFQYFASDKISFDFDDVLTTDRGLELARRFISQGAVLYIISARQSVGPEMISVANKLSIPETRVFATGSNQAKVKKVSDLGVKMHVDNNADVIKSLPMGIGQKFLIEPKSGESQEEYISRCIGIEVGNGYEQDQAAAMCYSKWRENNNNKLSSQHKFSADREKRIISGPLMVADLPIYRNDAYGEYYGLFTAEDIWNIRNKFFKAEYSKNVNEMHDPEKKIDGIYMVESFIIDSARGIHSPDGYKLKDGSWFGSYKVDNEDIWNNFIKTGEFKGFSIEGVFKTVQIDSKPQTIIEKIIDVIKQIED